MNYNMPFNPITKLEQARNRYPELAIDDAQVGVCCDTCGDSKDSRGLPLRCYRTDYGWRCGDCLADVAEGEQTE